MKNKFLVLGILVGGVLFFYWLAQSEWNLIPRKIAVVTEPGLCYQSSTVLPPSQHAKLIVKVFIPQVGGGTAIGVEDGFQPINGSFTLLNGESFNNNGLYLTNRAGKLHIWAWFAKVQTCSSVSQPTEFSLNLGGVARHPSISSFFNQVSVYNTFRMSRTLQTTTTTSSA